jgi:hypothetical protein
MPIPHKDAVIICNHCTDLQYSPEAQSAPGALEERFESWWRRIERSVTVILIAAILILTARVDTPDLKSKTAVSQWTQAGELTRRRFRSRRLARQINQEKRVGAGRHDHAHRDRQPRNSIRRNGQPQRSQRANLLSVVAPQGVPLNGIPVRPGSSFQRQGS